MNPQQAPRFGFGKRLRVKQSESFRLAHRTSAVAVDDRVVVTVLANSVGYCRLGISIPKKTGNAPQRNRWKRLIREAFRLNQATFAGSWDIFVRPRKGGEPDFHALKRDLPKLVQRACRKSR